MLYPQNGDRIVNIDSVTLFHPMYRPTRDYVVCGTIIGPHGMFSQLFCIQLFWKKTVVCKWNGFYGLDILIVHTSVRVQ